MTVLNALSQPLPTLTSSQVLKEPNPWRCPVPLSVPAPVPAEIRSCWMSCVVLVRIPSWQRQHFTASGSRKEAAPGLRVQVCREGRRSDPKGCKCRGCSRAGAALGLQRRGRNAVPGLCSGCPGPGGARRELGRPFLHRQRPPAPPAPQVRALRALPLAELLTGT